MRSTDRSSHPACFAGYGSECGSSHRVSKHPRSWRGASSSTHPPPGCASSTHQMKPGWLQPPSPSFLAPKAVLAAGRASLCHPLQPAKLPGPSSARGDAPAQRMALTAKWVSPGQAPSTPLCQQGRQGNVSSVTALTPHLLSGKCLITVHS